MIHIRQKPLDRNYLLTSISEFFLPFTVHSKCRLLKIVRLILCSIYACISVKLDMFFTSEERTPSCIGGVRSSILRIISVFKNYKEIQERTKLHSSKHFNKLIILL
jgi:hypothetical protein